MSHDTRPTDDDHTHAPGPRLAGGSLVGPELQAVEARLLDICTTTPGTLSEAVQRAITAGGKRLRPLLLLLSARTIGRPNDATVELAAAVEVMHLASLMHDDVLDESTLRRGKPSVRETWGNRTAVLVGDYLLARAYEQLTQLRDWSYVAVLADVALQMSTAEAAFADVDSDVTAEHCIEVARGKTATLVCASCQLGAMSVGADGELAGKFAAFGENLGIAFQVTDDLLDIYGDEKTIGKNPGRDIQTGQLTLPVVAALRSPMAKEVRQAIGALSDPQTASPEASAELGRLVKESGGMALATKTASEYVSRARGILGEIEGDREALDALGTLAGDIVTRRK